VAQLLGYPGRAAQQPRRRRARGPGGLSPGTRPAVAGRRPGAGARAGPESSLRVAPCAARAGSSPLETRTGRNSKGLRPIDWTRTGDRDLET
jgi:hypothetical protein